MSIGEDAVEELKHFFHTIEDQLENHFNEELEDSRDMNDQPYSIECSECGGEVSIHSKVVDCDNDLLLTIKPCENCIEAAKEEAKEESVK